MVEISTFDRVRKWFSFNRLNILNGHYIAIKDEMAPVSESDKAEVKYLSSEFERYYKKTKRLSNWRVLFYVILYASALTTVLSMIPVLRLFVAFIQEGTTLLGAYITVFAFIIIFLLTVRINIHIQRMQSCMMHLTYFYSSNKKRDSKKALKTLGKFI